LTPLPPELDEFDAVPELFFPQAKALIMMKAHARIRRLRIGMISAFEIFRPPL
jgi:hypothetical protein